MTLTSAMFSPLRTGLGLLISLAMLNGKFVATHTVKIGVLMDDMVSSKQVKDAMQSALEAATSSGTFANVSVHILYDVTKNQISAFENIQSVCSLVEKGVSLVIGPSHSSGVITSYPVCAGMHIPQIAPSAAESDLFVETDDYNYLFKLSPPVSVQIKGIVDVIRYYGWQRIAFLGSFTRLGRHSFDEFNKYATQNNWTLSTVQFFQHNSNLSEVNVTQQLLNIRSKGSRVVIFSSDVPSSRVVFEQAFTLDMLSKRWAWILSDGDESLDDLFDTCTDPPIFLRGLIAIRASRQDHAFSALGRNSSVHAHLHKMYDAMLIALSGLEAYFSAGHVITNDSPKIGVCSTRNSTYRKDGDTLHKHLLNATFPNGLPVFTEFGNPSSYILNIMNLQENGWVKVGDWSDQRREPLKWTGSMVMFPGQTDAIPNDIADQLKTLTLDVVTILENPFAMLRTERERQYKPRVEYKGFCIELLNLLQEELGFKYTIHVVSDQKYGEQDSVSGKWNGLMGEIIRGDADVVVAPLTITYERQRYVDFTKPFFDLGLGVLVAKEAPKSHLLAFLEPFHWDLWTGVIICFFLCGAAVTYCSYASPFGFYGRYAQRLDQDDHRYKGQSTVLNFMDNLWYIYASWQTQGPEITPRCLSGRIIHGAWWIFVTVITASYTANLTAFLTVDNIELAITSIFDLADQTDISYGTVESSAPAAFFAQQKDVPFRRMYEQMNNRNSWVPNATVGINRVYASYGVPKESGKQYAFIFDSTTLEHAAQNMPCNTAMVGKIFNNFGYGLAFRKNSPYKDIFSLKILKLRQSGELGKLRDKWFTGTCDLNTGSRTMNTKQQSLSGMAGVFAFLCFGIVTGLLVVPCEIANAIRKHSVTSKDLNWYQSLKIIFARIREDIVRKAYCNCLTQTENIDMQKDTKQYVAEIDGPNIHTTNISQPDVQITRL